MTITKLTDMSVFHVMNGVFKVYLVLSWLNCVGYRLKMKGVQNFYHQRDSCMWNSDSACCEIIYEMTEDFQQLV